MLQDHAKLLQCLFLLYVTSKWVPLSIFFFSSRGKYQVVKVSPGGSLPLTPLTPSHSSCSLSLLLLPLTSLAPSCSSHSPCSLSPPLAPNGQYRVGVCYTMFWGPHHLCGSKGQEAARGVRGSEVSKRGVRGGKRE